MPDDFTPSPCPLLDFGVKLEPHDPRDPWRRLPDLFTLCKGIFGRGMFSHDGKARRQIEARCGHYCKVTRETHGACTMRRSKLCQSALADEIQRSAFAPKGQEFAYVQSGITRLLRSERHHHDMKMTRVAQEPDSLPMPPITLMDIPHE